MSHHFDVSPLPGYPLEYGLLLASLEDSSREWRGELGEVPQPLMSWQPYRHAPSIGANLLHIAFVEAWWVESFCLGGEVPTELDSKISLEGTSVDNLMWGTPPDEPLSYYFDLLDTVRQRTLEFVKEFPEPESVKANNWGTMTLRWVLAHVVQHDSYHGGQAVLLKYLGYKMGPGA